jgi:CheY-like chemotaxis protein
MTQLPGTTILVVDDCAAMRDWLGRCLSPLACTIINADSGQRALNIVEQRRPDLVVLDLVIPPPNGFEVCRRLKSDRKTSAIPIVMISGLRHQVNITEGRRAGADYFLLKPFDEAELLAVVSESLR